MITYYTKKGKFRTKEWYGVPFNKLHRLDGPAVWVKGRKEWWINGKRHRLDGPAYINNGYNIWFVNSKKLNKKEVETWIKLNHINLKTKQHQALFILRFG